MGTFGPPSVYTHSLPPLFFSCLLSPSLFLLVLHWFDTPCSGLPPPALQCCLDIFRRFTKLTMHVNTTQSNSQLSPLYYLSFCLSVCLSVISSVYFVNAFVCVLGALRVCDFSLSLFLCEYKASRILWLWMSVICQVKPQECMWAFSHVLILYPHSRQTSIYVYVCVCTDVCVYLCPSVIR